MSALAKAVEKVGGVPAAAAICSVSPQAVRKWLAKGRLPRTEYTGESSHAEALAQASGGGFTAEWLLANSGHQASTPKLTPAKPTETTA